MNWLHKNWWRLILTSAVLTLGALVSYDLFKQERDYRQMVESGWHYEGDTTLSNAEYADIIGAHPDASFTLQDVGHDTILASYSFESLDDVPGLDRHQLSELSDDLRVATISIAATVVAAGTLCVVVIILLAGTKWGNSAKERESDS